MGCVKGTSGYLSSHVDVPLLRTGVLREPTLAESSAGSWIFSEKIFEGINPR